MYIVLAVAAIALHRCIAKLFSSNMALGTLHLLVFGAQAEVCRGVVKLFFVKVSNLGHTALVVGVASSARLLLHLSVKACLGTHIGSHILVAIHAQAILCLAVKLGMALFALVIYLGVGLHQFAGRNDGFNSLRSSARSKAQASK